MKQLLIQLQSHCDQKTALQTLLLVYCCYSLCLCYYNAVIHCSYHMHSCHRLRNDL